MGTKLPQQKAHSELDLQAVTACKKWGAPGVGGGLPVLLWPCSPELPDRGGSGGREDAGGSCGAGGSMRPAAGSACCSSLCGMLEAGPVRRQEPLIIARPPQQP
jgi:hypothetical protein